MMNIGNPDNKLVIMARPITLFITSLCAVSQLY